MFCFVSSRFPDHHQHSHSFTTKAVVAAKRETVMPTPLSIPEPLFQQHSARSIYAQMEQLNDHMSREHFSCLLAAPGARKSNLSFKLKIILVVTCFYLY